VDWIADIGPGRWKLQPSAEGITARAAPDVRAPCKGEVAGGSPAVSTKSRVVDVGDAGAIYAIP